MSLETSESWIAQAEVALRSIKDVYEARVFADDEDVREIHVTTRSTRAAKQIVRDIQSVLAARFRRRIDHRVVSVAYLTPEEPAPAVATEASSSASLPDEGSAPRPSVMTPRAGSDGRVRFVGVNLYVSGPRAQAQVELRWKGIPRMGSASGWSTRDGAHQLVAQATLSAVQEFLADELALVVREVGFVKISGSRVVLVGVSLVTGREERLLLGTCPIGKDLHQSVVLATLSALNRLLGELRTKEPTEYVLRPAST
ncbi:MAG: hypothetical protein HOP12_07670 [Candidatus Eisenbacteria bacterium]|uniref:Uncharacterized protein n=1 Tax=Eiseniibacteriota bacterium TaxID=2212470 RepID=A0A849SF78_UNCEI|nr:hypothetical protein [Candidatus Eisenbacteria bacterium]